MLDELTNVRTLRNDMTFEEQPQQPEVNSEEPAPRAVDVEERRRALLDSKDTASKKRLRLPSLKNVDTDRILTTSNFVRLAVIAVLIVLGINLAGALGQGSPSIQRENVGVQRLGTAGLYVMVPASWGTRLPEGEFETPMIAIETPATDSGLTPTTITIKGVDITSWFNRQLDAEGNPLPTTALLDSFVNEFLADYEQEPTVETVFYSSPDNPALQLEARLVSFPTSPLDPTMHQEVMITLPNTPTFRTDTIMAVLLTFSYDLDQPADEVSELAEIWRNVRQSLTFT